MEKFKTIKFGFHDFGLESYNRPIMVSYVHDTTIAFENVIYEKYERYGKFNSAIEHQGKSSTFALRYF